MYCLSIFFLSVYMEYSRVGKRKERKKLSVAKFAVIDGVNYLVGDRGDTPPSHLKYSLEMIHAKNFFFRSVSVFTFVYLFRLFKVSRNKNECLVMRRNKLLFVC